MLQKNQHFQFAQMYFAPIDQLETEYDEDVIEVDVEMVEDGEYEEEEETVNFTPWSLVYEAPPKNQPPPKIGLFIRW